MSTIDVNSVLAQIRTLSAQTQLQNGPKIARVAPEGSGAIAGTEPVKQTPGFGSLMRDGIQSVNESQQNVAKLQQAFELGDPSVDLATVMTAGAKAQVSFRAMVEVRNRLVSAYQEVMNMPI